ncbi:MAG TPA: hypothetical protein VLA90_05800 [Actinomycetota bacterium]|nr:hypothetical protein [Actinomycetota bacterium]
MQASRIDAGGAGRASSSTVRAGLCVCGLAAATLLAWVAGWGWLATVTGFALFAVGAAAAGADSRRPGDWTRVQRR